MSNIIISTDNCKINYLRYLGNKDLSNECHQIRIDMGILHSDLIVYYNNNLYSFLQMAGSSELLSNEITNKIKNSLDNLRKDCKIETEKLVELA